MTTDPLPPSVAEAQKAEATAARLALHDNAGAASNTYPSGARKTLLDEWPE